MRVVINLIIAMFSFPVEAIHDVLFSPVALWEPGVDHEGAGGGSLHGQGGRGDARPDDPKNRNGGIDARRRRRRATRGRETEGAVSEESASRPIGSWISPPWKVEGIGLRNSVTRGSKWYGNLPRGRMARGLAAPGKGWDPAGNLTAKVAPKGILSTHDAALSPPGNCSSIGEEFPDTIWMT